MFKFLLIIFLIVFLIFRVGGMIFRMLFGSVGNQHQTRSRQSKDGLNVNKNKPSRARREGYKGGEYVDFEEVD